MAVVLVNGQEIEIGDDECLNGIQIARRAGVEIPHYCWHEGLSVVASCRMCLGEIGRIDSKTGETSMVPKLVPACQTPATAGTVFVTESEKVLAARAMVEEDLLINHPIDCPICDKAGECLLQDYHFKHGQSERRADVRPFTSRRRELGERVTLFVDRCVMCTRCVRFAREISGTSELMVTARGSSEEIDVFPGFPLDNKLSGNVVDLCPVGALGDQDFLYSQRVWFMKSHDGVCTGCSTGCSIKIDENQDQIYRLRPRENPHVNQWWMCDEGRYGFHHVHDPRRCVEPRRRRRAEDTAEDGTAPDGSAEQHVNVEWSELPDELNAALAGSGSLSAVLSPHLTVEEAYLLAKYIRSLDASAPIALGPVPVVGEDERFPNGFTIHAEKCPNRRGVEQVVAHFMGRRFALDDLLAEIDAGRVSGVWVSGGYTTDWIDESTAARFESLELLVVQDLFDSPLWRRADYQLPGAAFAERDGSYVNQCDRLQSAAWAIRPPSGVQVEGRLFWRLMEMPGMYNARAVLDEVAREIGYFAVAAGEVPPVGVDLKVTQLAST